METINKKVLDILQDNSPIEITFKSCIPYTSLPLKNYDWYKKEEGVKMGDCCIHDYKNYNQEIMDKIRQAIIDIITEDENQKFLAKYGI